MGWGPRKKPAGFDVLAYRRRMGFTQAQLAKSLPVAEMSINRWERHGVKPLPWCVKKMMQLERAKLAGVRREVLEVIPCVRRKNLPKPSVQTGLPSTISISPSSF